MRFGYHPIEMGETRSATAQIAVVGFLAFCGPGLFNALNGLGNAGSSDPSIAAIANGVLYCTFAVFGYLGGAAFNILGPLPLLTLGGLTYAVYAVCVYFTFYMKGLAVVGGLVLGMGAGLFWTAQGSLMMAYATPSTRGRLVAMFWMIFNFGGVVGGLLQFGLNYNTEGGGANAVSYFAFVVCMVVGAVSAPFLLASPSSVVREDGTPVVFEEASSFVEEVTAALQAFKDPFVQRCLPFFFASNFFYPYIFNGFNGHQFNVRTRGLNSAVFWGAEMVAACVFCRVLDAEAPPKTRAYRGLAIVVFLLVLSLGVALRVTSCNGGRGWDKGAPCALDFAQSYPTNVVPMVTFVLLGAADAVYQNFAYWLMSMAAGSDARKTVMYAAVYKGVQSLGAGVAWLIDLPATTSYHLQGLLVFVLTVSACLPIIPTFSSLDGKKTDFMP